MIIRTMLAAMIAFVLAACAGRDAGGLAPIAGSITYGGQPRTKLLKAPAGSTFEHRFQDGLGRRVIETYRIQPDRSLLLVHRRVRIEYF